MKKINGSLKFLIIVFIVYLIISLFNFDYAYATFKKTLIMLKGVVPLILFVFFAMFVVNILIDEKKIKKHLGKGTGIMGWIYSIIGAILIPAPPYIIFPMLGNLQKKGMRNSLIVSFLYNGNLQLTFLPVLAYYFGIYYTVIVSVYIFIFSIISGIIIEKYLESS